MHDVIILCLQGDSGDDGAIGNVIICCYHQWWLVRGHDMLLVISMVIAVVCNMI